MERKLTADWVFKVKGKKVTGISIPVNENPQGLRAIVNRQIDIRGREVIVYLPDMGVLRKISCYDFEEARHFSRNGRQRFLDTVLEEAQFADRIAIQNSSE